LEAKFLLTFQHIGQAIQSQVNTLQLEESKKWKKTGTKKCKFIYSNTSPQNKQQNKQIC